MPWRLQRERGELLCTGVLSNGKVGVVNGCPAGGSAVSWKAGLELDSYGWISAISAERALDRVGLLGFSKQIHWR